MLKRENSKTKDDLDKVQKEEADELERTGVRASMWPREKPKTEDDTEDDTHKLQLEESGPSYKCAVSAVVSTCPATGCKIVEFK